jgi:SAM-dependent methyltransferase
LTSARLEAASHPSKPQVISSGSTKTSRHLSAARSATRSYPVIATAGRLHLAAGTIDLVVCNHALEHISGVEAVLDEIERVLKPEGRLYVSVPNGNGFCDNLYRWLFDGGGHINRFRREDVVRLVESRLGLRLAKSQDLYSSFVYLHLVAELRNNPVSREGHLKRVARCPARALHAVQWLIYGASRLADRVLGT